LPGGVLGKDIHRLGQAIRRHSVKRLLIVGDLIHSAEGLTNQVIEAVSAWRADFSEVELILIEGNHDQKIKQIPEEWGFQVCEHLEVSSFLFSHEPKVLNEGFLWAGHLHPTYVMRSGHDRLRLACFFISQQMAILPAFSSFTNGIKMRKTMPDDRVFVTTGKSLIEV